MNKAEFKKMLVGLALNYNHDLSKERLNGVTDLAEGVFGFNHDWQKVTLRIAANETFFPNIAQIKKYLNVENSVELADSSHKAKVLVDRFVSYLEGSLQREDISESDLAYCKKKFNVDRFSYARGDVDMNFRRREWIDMVKLDFDYGVSGSMKTQKELSGQTAGLVRNLIKEVDPKIKPKQKA